MISHFFCKPRSQKRAQDSVDPGDAPALLFDQCCFCPDKKLPKRAGSLRDRGFYDRPDPPYPEHMKIVVTQGRLMCSACRRRWKRPPLVPAKPPSRRKKAAAASTSAAPPPKKPRTVAQSLNDANTALKKKYKASWDYYAKMNKFEEGYDYTEAFS